jgi:hypothetical protein
MSFALSIALLPVHPDETGEAAVSRDKKSQEYKQGGLRTSTGFFLKEILLFRKIIVLSQGSW